MPKPKVGTRRPERPNQNSTLIGKKDNGNSTGEHETRFEVWSRQKRLRRVSPHFVRRYLFGPD